MGFVQAWSTATGREQLVPAHFFDDPRLSRGLTRKAPTADATPTKAWTIAQLTDYAAAHDIDLGGASLKADIFDAVSAAVEAASPPPEEPSVENPIVVDPDGDPDVDTSSESDNQTPVTGENQE